MTKTNEYDISEIKSRVSIYNLLTRHGVEHNNRPGKIRSPMRDEKTPSMMIYPDNSWYDYGAGHGGSVVDLEVSITGCSVGEAIRTLAAIAQLEPSDTVDGSPLSRIPEPRRKPTTDEESPLLSVEKARSLRVNLRDALTDKTCYAVKSLSWVPQEHLPMLLKKGWLGADHKMRLAYLFRRGFKVRTTPGASRGDRWVLGKAKHNLFVSYKDHEDINNQGKDILLLTEGESDAMAAAIQWGDRCKIAGCLSSSISPPMEMLYPLMRGVKKVIILFDGDKAGKEGGANLREYLLKAEAFRSIAMIIAPMPDGEDVKKLYCSKQSAGLNKFVTSHYD